MLLNQEFLGSGEGSKSVREYLTKVSDDEVVMLRFLKGRKHRPKHAWETVCTVCSYAVYIIIRKP